MKTNEIKKRVFEIIENYTHEKIKEDTKLREDAGLDSIDQVEICMDIEAEFSLFIEDSELFSPKVNDATAGEIADMVIEKLKKLEEEA